MDEKLQLLIVDDNQSALKTLSLIFGQKGYAVTTAETGREALEIASTQPLNLALLDIKLPDIEGVLLIAPLIEMHPDIAVIMVTGYASVKTAVKALEGGAAAYVTKPLDFNELLAKISQALEKQHLIVENKRLFQLAERELAERRQAEEALRESEERYRLLHENSGLGIGCYTPDGIVISFNTKASKDMNGLPEDFAGKSIFDLFPKELADCYFNRMQKAVNTDEITAYEDFVQLPTQEKWFLSTYNKIVNSNNEIVGIQISSQDITARKQSEAALRQSTQLLEALQSIAKVGGWELDIPTNQLFWTAGTYRIHETSPEEFNPSVDASLDYYPPVSRQILSAAIQAAMERGKGYDLLLEMLTAKGRRIDVRTTCEVTLHEGRPVKLIGIVQNITERRQAEAARRLQNAALNASANAIVITDITGTILFVNPAFTRLTYYTAAEAIGRKPSLLKSGKQDRKNYTHLWQTILAGEVWQGQLINRRKDGTLYIDKQTITPMRDNQGEITHFIAIKEDISHQVAAEEEIRQRNRELTLLNQIIVTATSTLKPEAVLEIVCRELALTFDLPQSTAALLDQTGAKLKIVAEYLSADQPTKLGIEVPLADNPASQYVIEHQMPLAVADAQHDPQMQAVHELMKQHGIVSILILPIIINGRMVGTVGLDAFERRTFTPAEITLATTVLTAATQVYANAQLLAELRERNLELSRLYQASDTLFSTIEPDAEKLAQCIVETTLDYFEQSNCSLVLIDADAQTLNRVAVSGPYTDEVLKQELRLDGPGLVAAAIRSRQILNVPNVHLHPNYLASWQDTRSELVIPLLIGEKAIGAIALQSAETAAFNDDDVRLMSTFAERAALALQNAMLFEEAHWRAEELEALASLSSAVGKIQTLEKMLPVILEEVIHLLAANSAALVRHEKTTDEIQISLAHGDWSQATGLHIPANLDSKGQLINGDQVYVGAEAANTLRAFRPDLFANLTMMVTVPLTASEEIIGTLWLAREAVLNQEEQKLLTAIADIAANAMQRAILHEQIVRHASELEQRVSQRTAELSTANTRLIRAARVKDDFLSSMSHELRTPLSSILLRGQLLQMGVYGPLVEKQTKSLLIIEESANHLLALINDILDLAKIEAGKISLEKQSTSARSICQASLRLVKEMAHQKQIELLFDDDQEEILLQADERRLKQMIVNLLSNAVKFTPESGKVGLEVAAVADQATIRFTVWDTGIGIAAEDMSRLFQPFEQLESGLSRNFEGTGLGLSLVQRLAQMHDGNITVESEVGQGSRFTITLPWQPKAKLLAEQKQTAVLTAEETNPIPSINTKTPYSFDRHSVTILLADDNEHSVVGLTEYLSSTGYQIIVARDGIEAVAQAKKERPDLILMDIQMPRMDGLEATRRIRADAELAAMPIIALTALVMRGDAERFIEAGMNAYLSKPVGLRDLDATIEAQLLESRARKKSTAK